MRKEFALLLVVLLFAAGGSAAESQQPPPAAPRKATIPQSVERTLENGLRVIVVQKQGVPLVAVRLLLKTGAEADPPDHGGLADITASLLTKGTKSRTAEQISREVEALGATIESGASWDYSAINLSALSSNFSEALVYVADTARNATFANGEIDRLRDQNIDALQVALGEPRSLATFVAMRVIFGAAAYGHNLGGTPESLKRITRSDITAFHRTYYRPDNAMLIITGDVAPATAFDAVTRLLASWEKPARPLPTHRVGERSASLAPRVLVVNMPDAGQAAVIAGRRGIRRADPAYSAALVANSILGGGYSSRLNQEIRIKRGLSYGAGSAFDIRRDEGPFTVTTQTKNESAAEVAGIIVDELNRLTSTTVPESELTPRKSALIGSFARSLETAAGLAALVSNYALHGLPLTEMNAYINGIQGVTTEQVQRFSETGVPGNSISLVIVGDAEKFAGALKQRFPNTEVLSIEQLDLNSPALRKP